MEHVDDLPIGGVVDVLDVPRPLLTFWARLPCEYAVAHIRDFSPSSSGLPPGPLRSAATFPLLRHRARCFFGTHWSNSTNSSMASSGAK